MLLFHFLHFFTHLYPVAQQTHGEGRQMPKDFRLFALPQAHVTSSQRLWLCKIRPNAQYIYIFLNLRVTPLVQYFLLPDPSHAPHNHDSSIWHCLRGSSPRVRIYATLYQRNRIVWITMHIFATKYRWSSLLTTKIANIIVIINIRSSSSSSSSPSSPSSIVFYNN